MTQVALGIFAREPIPGKTKTRLIPALGAEGAAGLHQCFLEDLLTRYANLAYYDVTLWVTGDSQWAQPLRNKYGVSIEVQCTGNLGARMLDALRRSQSANSAKAILIGSDVPTLPVARIHEAILSLNAEASMVFGPSSDGGYYLVGTHDAPDPLAFQSIEWSTERVMEQTLSRMATQNVRLLSPWYDVDTPEDLRLLSAHLAIDPAAAPHTAELLLASQTQRGSLTKAP